ncbi:MAG: sugar phosphate isomerase/epimerase family protein [Limisphaerales bacterium]
MNSNSLNRRDLFKTGAVGAAVLGAGTLTAEAKHHEPKPQFKYCLNTSTISARGVKKKITIEEQVDVAGKAGYQAIEPWLRDIQNYLDRGNSLKDLNKRIKDHGLTVESAIGFANWIVNEDDKRAQGLEDMKRDMGYIAELGGTRIAAPPAGRRTSQVSLDDAADRYRAVLEVGVETGVVPQVEMWGAHPWIGTVEKAIYVAIKAGHPKACFLGDIYHTYKGGCDFAGLKLLSPQALQCFHFNDYPADPPRETIRDSHRVYPGDGIAPISDILKGFVEVGATPVLSLELFNPEYWKRPPLEIATTGLAKMKASVKQAFG